MDTIRVNLKKQILDVPKGITCNEILMKINISNEVPVVLCRINGELKELGDRIEEDCDLELVDISVKIGMMAYVRTLQFIFLKAVDNIFPRCKVTIEHSLSKGLFGEIYKNPSLCVDDIYAIKLEMNRIINKDFIIKRHIYLREEAINILEEKGLKSKAKLFSQSDDEIIKLYELDENINYFYGPMAYSTGVVKYFDLIYYDPGFILRFPTIEEPKLIPRFENHKKLAKVFYEAERWAEILDVSDVSALNQCIIEDEQVTLVRVAEALQEKKIAHIADKINKNRDIKLVLIAGPSSSGKTTFSKRLGIQLRVNGLIPIPISLDDYFVNRDDTPKDEFGEFDFESIYALDLNLFNANLNKLLDGEEIEIPNYNFKTGKREWNGHKLKLPSNGVVVIEGIHGLNETLTSSINHDYKFKIYISPLTQINMDCHNRVATTDVRILRRIVRDYLSRGYDVEYTLKMWPSIRRGEDKNIFVYQEEADAMFNSALIYELSVLKKYALKELYKVKKDSTVYDEARRLIELLHFFRDIDKETVPTNSLMREFIGGSCFYQY